MKGMLTNRALGTIVVLFLVIFTVSYCSLKPEKLSPEQQIAKDFNEDPSQFVMLTQSLKRRSEMTTEDWRTWEEEQYQLYKRYYVPDKVRLGGSFLQLGNQYVATEYIVSFRDISKYTDLPRSIVEIRVSGGINYKIYLNCKVDEIAEAMKPITR